MHYKDYRRPGADRRQVMTPATDEFVRRFLNHVLPPGFASRLVFRVVIGRQSHIQQFASGGGPCPCCRGRMIIIELFACRGQPRAPPYGSPAARTTAHGPTSPPHAVPALTAKSRWRRRRRQPHRARSKAARRAACSGYRDQHASVAHTAQAA
ncbi:transposase [Mesorhizobium sp. M0633]|uniref:transposase n=1 Tax=Mesorhizobium sp. M0633 TaxID=2956977 RepID=UPI00333670C0